MGSITKTDIDEHDIHVEPGEITRDVADSGILGAVGGGIVGALAGGPLGAIIGAVVGGGASAAAIDMIERRDGDSDLQTTDGTLPELVKRDNAVQKDAGPIGDGSTSVVTDMYVIESEPIVIVAQTDTAEDKIRRRAFEMWEERGHVIGASDHDWFDAEREYQEQLYATVSVDDLNDPEEVEEVVGYSE